MTVGSDVMGLSRNLLPLGAEYAPHSLFTGANDLR